MKVLWHDAANADADEAAAFYFDKHPGLGRAYIDELDAAVQRVQRHPLAYRRAGEGHARVCRVRRFPFALVYRSRAEFIEIIAVMHLRRAPGYWLQRAE